MYKYLLLSSKIEHNIENGTYPQGSKLPSIRTLCDDFSMHKSTVIKALDVLIQKNLIYVVPQSGYYVISRVNIPLHTEQAYYDFETSSPDPQLFPYQDFQQCINQAIHKYKAELFVYGTSRGLPGLINISKQLLMKNQIFTNSENLIITSGVQQALSILINMPFPNNGDTILIEQPSYHLLVEQLQTLNIKTAFIERTFQGLNLDALEKIFSQGHIKFFYIMPRFHNPLGDSLNKQQKKAIIDLAYKYKVYIVEDDFLADYETNTKMDPLFSYDLNRQYVIYLKSYSKIIFPGLRTALAVLPDLLVTSFVQRKIYASIDSSMISQAALEIYHRSGMFEQHSQKINALYDSKATILHDTLSALSRNADKFSYIAPESKTIFTCVELNHPVPVSKLKSNDIYVKSISENYALNFTDKRHYLRLNVSNMHEKNIKEGLIKLQGLI